MSFLGRNRAIFLTLLIFSFVFASCSMFMGESPKELFEQAQNNNNNNNNSGNYPSVPSGYTQLTSTQWSVNTLNSSEKWFYFYATPGDYYVYWDDYDSRTSSSNSYTYTADIRVGIYLGNTNSPYSGYESVDGNHSETNSTRTRITITSSMNVYLKVMPYSSISGLSYRIGYATGSSEAYGTQLSNNNWHTGFRTMGDVQWYYIYVPYSTTVSVYWRDMDVSGYNSYSDIKVSAYAGVRTDSYKKFGPTDRNVSGSASVTSFQLNDPTTVYIKVEGYNSTSSGGTYEIRVQY